MIALGEIDEVDAEALLNLMIGHDPSSTDLMPVGKAKVQANLRSGHGRNKALDENSLSRQIDYPAISAAPIEFATGT